MNPLEWLSNKFGIGKVQPPKLPRSQQELLDFRNFKKNEVMTQVNKDAAAGAKAMKTSGAAATSTKPGIGGKIGTQAAISTGLYLSEQLARSAGTPGAARMSSLGLGPTGRGSDAPVYDTPLNNNKPQMAYFGDNYKEEEAKLFVDAARSQGIYSSSLPPSAATPGEGPKGNEVGSDADPNTPGLQGPGAPITPGRPSEVDGGISTTATVALDLEAANGLLSRGGSSENPNRFLAEGTQMADINSFLPAPIPVSGNDKPSAPVDQSEPTQLGGDEVAEGVVTQQKPTTISPDGADNTRSISVPGEIKPPRRARGGRQQEVSDRVNFGRGDFGVETPDAEVDPQKAASEKFLAARRSAFLDLNNRGYGAIRAADAATGRFRQGDKFFYNDAGTMREVDEQTYRKGQHQPINPLDEMEEGSKFMEGWKDSKIKPTLVPSEQTDITNPDADGGRNPQLSDFNDANVAPTPVTETLRGFAPAMSDDTSITGPMPAGDGGETLLNSNVPEVFSTHLKRARGKRGS